MYGIGCNASRQNRDLAISRDSRPWQASSLRCSLGLCVKHEPGAGARWDSLASVEDG